MHVLYRGSLLQRCSIDNVCAVFSLYYGHVQLWYERNVVRSMRAWHLQHSLRLHIVVFMFTVRRGHVQRPFHGFEWVHCM